MGLTQNKNIKKEKENSLCHYQNPLSLSAVTLNLIKYKSIDPHLESTTVHDLHKEYLLQETQWDDDP